MLQLDWHGQIFAAKLKNLIASLSPSETRTEQEQIYKFPGKAAGDPFDPEDSWLSSMNYKLALKSCSNRFNLENDEELINRCRHFAITNAEYDINNMKSAFNFKYDDIDKQNIYPDTE